MRTGRLLVRLIQTRMIWSASSLNFQCDSPTQTVAASSAESPGTAVGFISRKAASRLPRRACSHQVFACPSSVILAVIHLFSRRPSVKWPGIFQMLPFTASGDMDLEMHDSQLLRAYGEGRDESAFGE